MSETSHPPKKRRRVPKWFKVTVIVALVLANAVAFGAWWAIRTGENILATASTDPEVATVLDRPTTRDTRTFLVVGSDSREGLDDLSDFGSFSGSRADVVMLVRVDGPTSRVQMLSIPRDLWVEIPGHADNRINASYAFGGSALLVETIKQNLNVEVNHYVEVNFAGFMAMIDELGGIEMTFPYPARDSRSGLNVEAGTQRVDGGTALAYARSRSYQEHRDGSWRSTDTGDFGRTRRQQEVMRAIMSELTSLGNIADAPDSAEALARHMIIDGNLADASVASLAWSFRGALTGGTEGATLPGTSRNIGGRSVVVATEPDATEMLANFRAGRPMSEQALRLQVLNGNGVPGAASDMSQHLQSSGFVVANIGDAPNSTYAQTTVIVPQGSDAGRTVVDSLGYGVIEVGSVTGGYDAVVIVGADAS